ncbi:GNAT family N-acetyltransferase [Paenibacillus puerhi]|uniref:GNAT family N-acetyltransferase n=1 Tax=Paenibacillus puerhi TaxID=2692622 RepID=UPI00135B27F8|nr:GNAT family N-acetyltransferase [Paenibacillus puerhi]
MGTIEIRSVPPETPELRLLIGELDEYLLELYPAEEVFGVDFGDPSLSEVRFSVAYADGQAVGCGAFRPLDGESAELKRFYVHPDYRRQGIAEAILLRLEQQAREQGHSCMRLEAGEPQQAAIRFYIKQGYYPIPSFGEYAECPSSVCYEKRLGPS